MTLRPAKRRFVFLAKTYFVKIWISRVIRLGQMDLNIRFKEVSDSLMNKILIQKRMRIRSAGEGFSDFITSFRDSSTTRSLFSYLSTLPEYIMKQTL